MLCNKAGWPLSNSNDNSASRSADLLDKYNSTITPSVSQPLPYRHQPLPPGPYIRVLRLEPGHYHDRINCSLKVASLDDDALQYDALSYEWGTGPKLHAIIVDGGHLNIMQNLRDLLIILRRTDTAIDLWADAICIDQSNIAEKNHQVQQMRRVYQCSRTTHIFLPIFNPIHDPISTLDAILRASYWTRLWIIQEVILSSQIVVVFGSERTQWTKFIEMCRSTADERKITQKTHQSSLEILGSTLLNLDTMRRFGNEKSLPALLRAYGQCKCSDVRDRVFGLLGLLEQDLIDVDYGLTRCELFTGVLRALPPKYPGRLVNNLWHALELDADDIVTAASQEQSRFSMLLSECGQVQKRLGDAVWNHHPEQRLIPFCVKDKSLLEGDLLYSLSSLPTTELSNRHACLLVLRRSMSLPQHPRTTTSKVSYETVGVTEIDHNTAKFRESERDKFLESLKDVSIFEDSSYGPAHTIIVLSLQTYRICRSLFEVNAPPKTAKLDWPTEPVEVIEL